MNKSLDTKFVICINNQGYEVSLEKRKIYQAVPDIDSEQLGYVRVIDESGEDYLFPAKNFLPITLPAQVIEAFALVE